MQDLNDLRFFAGVVEQNGFAAAARKLGMPRSRLSRRIGLLELTPLLKREKSSFSLHIVRHGLQPWPGNAASMMPSIG